MTSDTGQQRHASTATRTVVVTVAVVAVLLLGAAVGLLIRLPGTDSSTTPGKDSVDIGFAQDMAVHHLQGITMANTARDKTADPAIRQLAFDIESTQLEQVGRMKGWLTLWGAPEQSVDGTHMAWMESASHHSSSSNGGTSGLMPGMATSDELAKLRSLSGTEFDVYFLQLMLRHHEGGAPMAQYAATHAGLPVVRTLADNMLKSQAGESTYMKQLIAERGAAPLP
ncbi:DUF305 domain-containing protein [Saccharothrix australiensis]|uniref:Uncharacterized protein (DUF305 family) n=1 Tax=Saccharothrix australiensis TaxID=2072 RepID=A0A495WBU3_9PSEU|nr:DUF305 domain-containing protein [Saccharothrix australiensis]RKT57298.1 uncharacterized protein (DUF305 family) [Saccharothrix australiensis]